MAKTAAQLAKEVAKELAQSNEIDLAVIKTDVSYIKQAVQRVESNNAQFATKEELRSMREEFSVRLTPIQRGFYFLVSLVVIAFIGGLAGLLWK